MTLKSARIAKIENLSSEQQEEIGLHEGFAIVEIRNPEPNEQIKPLTEEGIRGYFLSLGNFNDVELED